MQVHFKKPIKEKLDEAIIEAKVQGKKIDWIELSGEEWQELETWLNHVRTVFSTDPTIESPAHYDGVEIRKKVKPKVNDAVIEAWKTHYSICPPRICDELIKRFGKVEEEKALRFIVNGIDGQSYLGWRDDIVTGWCGEMSSSIQVRLRYKNEDYPWVRPGDELEVRVKRRGK